MELSAIEDAIEVLSQGGMVIVVDDEGRENEGDLVMAAEFATAESLAFIVRHCCGIVCAPMSGTVALALDLPLMVTRNTESMRTAFTVSVDLIKGVTTGVSASDRALTLRALAAPSTRPEELARPGHIFPLIAREGGVLERPGHTEATIDLLRLAGLKQVGVICEVVRADGGMARRPDLDIFAREHNLKIISIEHLAAWRQSNDPAVPVRMAVAAA